MQRLLAALILSLLLAHVPTAKALDPSLRLTQMSQRNWLAGDSPQSLPQNSVFALAQTSDRFVWVGTQEGLARFDGLRFTRFNRENTPALAHNDVGRLLASPDGALWIGTRGGGVTRLLGGQWTHFGAEEGLEDGFVHALHLGAGGQLLVGTRSGKLYALQGGKFVALNTRGLPDAPVESITQTENARTLVAVMGQGIFAITANGAQKLPATRTPQTSLVWADGPQVWVGDGPDLLRLALPELRETGRWTMAGAGWLRTIQRDRDGNLWVAGDGGGLARLTPQGLESFAQLANEHIGALLEDLEGSLWLGSDTSGLTQLRGGPFRPIGTPEGLVNDNLRSITQADDGAMWLGSFGGLSRWSQGRMQNLGTAQGLPDAPVLSLAPAGGDGVWLGTLGAGLWRWQDGKVQSWGADQGLSHPIVLSLLRDSHGVLWVGTRAGGLHRLGDDGRLQSISAQSGLLAKDIRALAESKDGALWIGSFDRGLVRYRDGAAQEFLQFPQLSKAKVFALWESPQGVLYVATNGDGLLRFDGKTVQQIGAQQGLSETVILQLIGTPTQLWGASNLGVFTIDYTQLDALATQKAPRVAVARFGSPDGLRSREANGGHQPSAWRAKDGSLWFATTAGAASLIPADAERRLPAPTVAWQALALDGQAIPPGPLTLPAGEHRLDLDFTAPSFVRPEALRFYAKLVGYDESWQDLGDRRTLAYANLPPGSYQLQLRAQNFQGSGSKAPLGLALKQTPKFTQTRWMWLIYGALALLLGGAGYQVQSWRVKQLRAREQQLLTLIEEKRVAQSALADANVHLAQRAEELARSNAELESFSHAAWHDLREPLRSIISYTQLLARRYGEQLDEDARSFIGYAKGAAQDFSGRLDALAAYLQAGKTGDPVKWHKGAAPIEAAVRAQQARIKATQADIQIGNLPDQFGAERDLVAVWAALLDNSLKFAAPDVAPRIQVSGHESDDARHYVWEDNGIGIPPEHQERVWGLFTRLHPREAYPGSGLGLATVQKLVRLLGGTVSMESISEGGLRVCLRFAKSPALGAAATPA